MDTEIKYSGYTCHYYSCDYCFNRIAFETSYIPRTEREVFILAIQCGWGWYAGINKHHETGVYSVRFEIVECPVCRSEDREDPTQHMDAKQIEKLLQDAEAEQREVIVKKEMESCNIATDTDQARQD